MESVERRLRIWDLVVRGFGTLLVTAVIGALGFYVDASLQGIERQWRMVEQRSVQARSVIELTHSQQALETDIATRLLENLMQEFFPDDEAQLPAEQVHERQLLQLRLTALNFQDIAINLKPFYEHLERELAGESPEAAARLKAIAREIANRQAYRLAFEGGIDIRPTTLRLNEVASIPQLRLRSESVALTVTEIGEEVARIRISAPYQGEIGPIEVSYFDMPLVDNVKLRAYNLRLALMLLETRPDEGEVDIRAVAFQPYMAGDRFDLHEATRQLQQPLDLEVADPFARMDDQ